MGRVSVKENKNIYQLRREELGLTRDKASELLGSMPPERIEKIESEKSLPHPDEVLTMSEGVPDWKAICSRNQDKRFIADCSGNGSFVKFYA